MTLETGELVAPLSPRPVEIGTMRIDTPRPHRGVVLGTIALRVTAGARGQSLARCLAMPEQPKRVRVVKGEIRPAIRGKPNSHMTGTTEYFGAVARGAVLLPTICQDAMTLAEVLDVKS